MTVRPGLLVHGATLHGDTASGDRPTSLGWGDAGSPRPAVPTPDDVLLQRARVLERLAGSTWHELAQPLGGIRAFLALGAARGWTADELGVDPALVEEAIARTQQLAHAMVDLARPNGQPAPLAAVVSDTLALAGHLLAEVDVTVDVPDHLPEPRFDPAILRLAVASLVADAAAAAAGPGAGRGTLSIAAREREGWLALVAEHPGVVADPLRVSLRGIVEDTGGRLRHERTATGGTRVILELPGGGEADEAPPSEGGTHPSDRSDVAGVQPDIAGRLTVLVVDDEAAIRKLLVRVLERAGMRAIPAASGSIALDALAREAVDVVLVDRSMRGMSGIELYGVAATRHPAIRHRVVLMSGDPGDGDLAAFASVHGLEVLAKPFDTALLPALLREVATR